MSLFKVWNGTAWITLDGWKKPKAWSGSAWQQIKKPKYATASGWSKIAVPQSITVTVGNYNYPGSKYVPAYNFYGYSTNALAYGSISSNVSLWADSSIMDIHWYDVGQQIFLRMDGDSIANDSFTTLTINGVTFARTAATYTAYTGYSTWEWASTTTNPFPATGNTCTVSWT
jgi:hypothetical protein